MAEIPEIPKFDASAVSVPEPSTVDQFDSGAGLTAEDQAMLERLSKLGSATQPQTQTQPQMSRSDNIISDSKQKSPPRPLKQRSSKAAKELDAELEEMAADDGLMEDRRAAARKLQERLESDPEFAERYKAQQAARAQKETRDDYSVDECSLDGTLADEDDLPRVQEDSEKMDALTMALERLGKACILIQNVNTLHVHIHK